MIFLNIFFYFFLNVNIFSNPTKLIFKINIRKKKDGYNGKKELFKYCDLKRKIKKF